VRVLRIPQAATPPKRRRHGGDGARAVRHAVGQARGHRQ
jgi:hypothetical protein